MRAQLIAGLVLFSAVLFADHPAVRFYVVESAELRKYVNQVGGMERLPLDLGELGQSALLQGYFEPPCSLYFKTKDHQYRFRVTQDKDAFSFRMGMFSQESGADVFAVEGTVTLKETFTAPPDWEKGKYAVLFRKENLKQ